MERKPCFNCGHHHHYLPDCPWSMHVDDWPTWFKEQVQHLEREFMSGKRMDMDAFWKRYFVLVLEWNYREKVRHG